MIGTNKQEVKAFVERSLDGYKNSIGYGVMCSSAQQEFINGKLYDLYKNAERSSSYSVLTMLKEVMAEYPGFSSYFNERQSKPQEKTPDLPWCDYVGNPDARRFWGLDSRSRSC